MIGSATGHLAFKVPGGFAFIDTYVLLKNELNFDQGYLNSTLKWSTMSSWDKSGNIYFFGDLSNVASTPVTSIKICEILNYEDNNYRTSTYLYMKHTEYLNVYGIGQYIITNSYNW